MNIQNKKNIIITLIIVAIIIIFVMILRFINKKGVFINLIENTSSEVVTILSNDTFSGNFDLTSNVNSYYMGNVIIPKMNSHFDYEINLNKGSILVDNSNNYNDSNKLDTDIYISDDKINIRSKDVYDKYVSFDADYLKLLDDLSDYRDVFEFIIDDLDYYLKNKYFKLTNDKVNDKRVNKITLDLTGDNYREVEKKINTKLSKDKKLKKSLKTLKKNGPFRRNPYVDLEKYPGFKLSMYMSKFRNELLKIEFHDETNNKVIVTFKKNKILFTIYTYDALNYEGTIEVKNKDSINKAIVLNLSNTIDDFYLKLKFNNFKFDINNKLKMDNVFKEDNSINYSDLNDDIKDKMKDNKVIDEVYDNYSKKDYEHVVEDPPEMPDRISEGDDINGE